MVDFFFFPQGKHAMLWAAGQFRQAIELTYYQEGLCLSAAGLNQCYQGY
jgi:hypothetical protein